jgi:hypothetical protein
MNADKERELSNRFEEALYGRVGTSDCHKVGIWGGCGLDCWVYQDGRCPEPDEMTFETEEDRMHHEQLYPKERESTRARRDEEETRMMQYDILHNGWTLNEYPIHENDLMDKLAKWKPLFHPLEVRESETENQTQIRRTTNRNRRNYL